jgi:hypothetical protein
VEDSSQRVPRLATGFELDILIQLAAAFNSFRLSRMKLTVLPQADAVLVELQVPARRTNCSPIVFGWLHVFARPH